MCSVSGRRCRDFLSATRETTSRNVSTMEHTENEERSKDKKKKKRNFTKFSEIMFRKSRTLCFLTDCMAL